MTEEVQLTILSLLGLLVAAVVALAVYLITTWRR